MSFTRSSRVRMSTTVGAELTTISKVLWKASTIACSSVIKGSLFAVKRQRFARNKFHGIQHGNLFLRRDPELLEPTGRRQDSRFERPDRFVVSQDALPERLPDVVQMLCQHGHPFIEIFS